MLPVPGSWRARREIDRLLATRRARLARLAWAWSGDPVLADDLVQEAYVRAVKAHRTLRDEKSADAWMTRILHRVFLDYLKSAKRREIPSDDHELERGQYAASGFETATGPEHQVMEQEQSRRVREIVAALPAGQRQVLALVDIEGFSYADCAGILGVPVGTVMSRLNRGRAALKTRLEAGNGASRRATVLKRIK